MVESLVIEQVRVATTTIVVSPTATTTVSLGPQASEINGVADCNFQVSSCFIQI